MRRMFRSRRVIVHTAVAFTQLVLAIPALLWWQDSVLFVIGLSLFANFYSAVSAVEAADDSKVIKRLEELERNVIASVGAKSAVEGAS